MRITLSQNAVSISPISSPVTNYYRALSRVYPAQDGNTPHPENGLETHWKLCKTIDLVLLRQTPDSLRAQGYSVELRGSDQDHPTTHWLTLSNDDHMITIKFLHALNERPLSST